MSPSALFRRSFIAALVCASGICSGYEPPQAVLSNIDKLRSYADLTAAAGSMDLDAYASNMITWQMSHGGWTKAMAPKYVKPWDGKEDLSGWTGSNGVPLGTFDNNATIQEMRLLAVRFKATKDATLKAKFKASFMKGVGYILASQYPSGGWPQVYPARGNYSDHVTYNDNAMTRLMVLVKDIVDKREPFGSDLVPSEDVAKLRAAFDKGIQYTLKAQIVDGGVPTVWCAQHDKSSHAPVDARAYELASKSGSESVAITWLLMSLPEQSAEIQKAAKASIVWFRKVRVADKAYDKSTGNFVSKPGASMWYRFYDLKGDKGFFCDRAGASSKSYDITTISMERRTGYSWAGETATALLAAESDYLAALGTPSGIGRPAEAVRPAIEIQGSRVIASVSSSGLWAVTVLNGNGGIVATSSAWSRDGRVEFQLPADSRESGLRIVRVTGPDGALHAARSMVRF